MTTDDATIRLLTEIRENQRTESLARQQDSLRLMQPQALTPCQRMAVTVASLVFVALLVMLSAMIGPR